MLTFQQIIQRLTQFWEKRGCIIHQGHDLETGAGTFNPATFLRCLGPEPYRTAYVEPSRRPSDARYGENPNRVQLFHQFQVILKPSPPDVQALYLKSLEAVGLDLKKHDIRFVHDDWESPTLGAWGLGWEVWSDGMEISQFTYFQAIGSLPLKPISAEITYGLERLAMYIQGVDSIFDVKWNETLTFADIIQRSEVEWSIYNFTQASSEMWMRHFDDYEREAKRLIGEHLPLPAYDFVIKASHAFNMLDARGVISVTERTGYIARIRELARLIAMEYVSSREKQDFPLLPKEEKKQKSVRRPKIPRSFDPEKRGDVLIEIGSEELPATFVPIGCQNLERAVRKLLEGFSFEALHVYGTPRRLAVCIKGLVEGTAAQVIERKGPPASVAYDAAGKPTAQGAGFMATFKAKNVTVKDGYLYAKVKQPGVSTFGLLATKLPELIVHLEFPKKMRWGDLDISYARPIHWIAALFDAKIIPFQVGDVTSHRTTYGHAQLNPKKILLKSAGDYLAVLKEHQVLASQEERTQVIVQQLHTFEKKLHAEAAAREEVLKEVLYLSEWPMLMEATFDARFLQLPSVIPISEMVKHQRYFPLVDKQGNLKNTFLITADNTPSDLIRKGNQKVLSARLTDGAFLYDQDLNAPLESYNEKLKVMTFQKELGSMFEKVMRLVSLSHQLNQILSLGNEKKLARAALLSKADLATALVGEFPELQGTVGKIYALAQNEDSEVASAIEEHWMPKAEAGALPKTPCGILLSLADKLDNLLSYFRVGLKPSAHADPYGLRRQSIGLLKILISLEKCINLRTLGLNDEILQYITQRAKHLFEEWGFTKNEIEACMQGLLIDPYDSFCKVEALHTFRKTSDAFSHLHEVYKRARGQLQGQNPGQLNPALARESAEQALLRELSSLQEKLPSALTERNYLKAFTLVAALQPHLAHLFDTVHILADDPALRANRIALLHKVLQQIETLLDLSKL